MSEEDDEKKLKIVIPDEVLAKFPDSERAQIVEDIKKAFEDATPDNFPGTLVEEIVPGTTHCPFCASELVIYERNRRLPGIDGDVDLFDCEKCDRTFMAPTRVC